MLLGRGHERTGLAARRFLVQVIGQLAVLGVAGGDALDLGRDPLRELEVAVRGVGQGHARELLDLLLADGLLHLRRQPAAHGIVGIELEQPAAGGERLLEVTVRPRLLDCAHEGRDVLAPPGLTPLLVRVRRPQAARRVAHQPFEVVAHLLEGLVPLGRRLGQGARHDPLEARRVRRARHGREVRLLAHDAEHHVGGAVPVEGPAVGEQLVGDRAHGEDVRPVVALLPDHLLGHHVVHGAQHEPALGHGRGLQVRDPEVHDLDLALVGDADVGGLDVAMVDPVAVRIAEPLADLPHDVELPFQGQGLALLDDLLEVGALDELHRDVGLAAVLAQVVDGDDVAVAQPSRRLRLAQEPRLELRRLRQARDHGLERDLAVDHRVVGLVDRTHAAAAQHLLHLVLADGLQ